MKLNSQVRIAHDPAGNPRISTFSPELWPTEKSFTATRNSPNADRLSASLSPEASARTLTLDWQCLLDGPRQVFGIAPGEKQRFTIAPDGFAAQQLDLDGLFVRRESSKFLIVFHGALDREKFILPRFEYQRALKEFDGSILFLQDPTLYVHKQLTLGWYIGNSVDNAHCMIKQLINIATDVLQPKQVLLTGSSGGGFAALAISARIPQSSALVFSPQTAIENYYKGHRRRLISSAFPELIPNIDSLSGLEDRFDMGALYSKGSQNKVFYLQNTGDPSHLKNHCLPFMKHAGLDFMEGEMRNERLKVECRFLRHGHGGPTPGQMQLYVNRVFADGF